MRTVRKGWIRVGPTREWWRCLMDDRGFVFIRGYGWHRMHDVEVRLLPAIYLYERWQRAEWWMPRLWSHPEWAWIYGAP